MKYLKFKLFAFVLAVGTFSSCGVDDGECSASAYEEILGVSGPVTALVDEEIVFEVDFKLPNTCAIFNDFVENNTFPREIAVDVKYEGCTCNAQNVTTTEEYIFSGDEAGEYELRFKTGPDTYITKLVTVTEAD